MTQKITAFDVETTGLNVETNHIIQLSVVVFDKDTYQISFNKQWVIKPMGDWEMEPGAQAVHGITKEYVMEHGVYLKDIADEILGAFGNNDVLTYNGNHFDINFLVHDLQRIGKTFDFHRTFFDSYIIESQRYPRTLQAVFTKYTGAQMTSAHDSLADTMATVAVFKAQMNEDPTLNESDFEILSPEGFLLRLASGEVAFAKGKYSRKPVVDVCKMDADYINWVFNKAPGITEVTKNSIRQAWYEYKSR